MPKYKLVIDAINSKSPRYPYCDNAIQRRVIVQKRLVKIVSAILTGMMNSTCFTFIRAICLEIIKGIEYSNIPGRPKANNKITTINLLKLLKLDFNTSGDALL